MRCRNHDRPTSKPTLREAYGWTGLDLRTILQRTNWPDRVTADLAHYKATDPDCGIRQVHIYPLGGLRRSARWIQAAADGEFVMHENGRNFTVAADIG